MCVNIKCTQSRTVFDLRAIAKKTTMNDAHLSKILAVKVEK